MGSRVRGNDGQVISIRSKNAVLSKRRDAGIGSRGIFNR